VSPKPTAVTARLPRHGDEVSRGLGACGDRQRDRKERQTGLQRVQAERVLQYSDARWEARPDRNEQRNPPWEAHVTAYGREDQPGGTREHVARRRCRSGTSICYDVAIVENGVVVEHADETTKLLGPLGAEVMGVLWSAREPLAVRAVLDRLNRGRAVPLAYTTVMTVLSRLTERGAAKRMTAGRGYAYEAAVVDAAELAVRDVVRDYGAAAVTHFVNQARTDPQLLERLRGLLGREAGNSEGDHSEPGTKGT
jgi:predicted transcriptional regulator